MPQPATADALIRRLDLQPHPEGGHYREVHRSERTVRRGDDDRAAITTIYYLLQAGEYSRWHEVASDEVWHYMHGAPLELLTFDPVAERLGRTQLGPIDQPACTPVHIVPPGHWQAARPTGVFALVGCTVGPGFDFADFRFVADIAGHRSIFDTHLGDHHTLL